MSEKLVTVSVQNMAAGITRLTLGGRFEPMAVAELAAALDGLGAQETRILADLTGLAFMAPHGLRLFVRLARKLQESRGKLVFLAPQPMVEEVISLAGVDELIPLFHTETEALAALSN
ncbi:STAS domain-containing protein [Acidocella sp.]|uniref:STAS domain-containing protein n=1 Tax=Acidocella sp. TaxID=50710 RepID=UPI0026102F1E|nr:STAS domain-containing protein [Acidocella sp.]